jgi:hypothetical protein
MSLEHEIESEIRLSDDGLAEKVEATEGITNAAELLGWATEHVFGPLLKNHQDAILRLAREIDELKGNSPS